MLTPEGALTLTPLYEIGSLRGDPVPASGAPWTGDDTNETVITLDGHTATANAPCTATITVTQTLPTPLKLGFDEPGGVKVRIAGTASPITTSGEDGGMTLAAGDRVTLVCPIQRNGEPLPNLKADVTIRDETNRTFVAPGRGVQPSTTIVALVLDEAQISLGAASVREDTTLQRNAPVPPGFEPGDATLCIVGRRAARTKLLVAAPREARSQTDAGRMPVT